MSIRDDLTVEQMQSVSKLILVYQEMVNISQEISEVLSRGTILARGVEELSSVEGVVLKRLGIHYRLF